MSVRNPAPKIWLKQPDKVQISLNVISAYEFSSLRENLLFKSPHSLRIRENTYQKKIRIWTLFTQCLLCKFGDQLPC